MPKGITIKNISIGPFKCFKRIDCSFERPEGGTYQWNVFLGNNNSGKTNLLKLLAGFSARESDLLNVHKTTSSFLLNCAVYYDIDRVKKWILGKDFVFECELSGLKKTIKWGWGDLENEENSELKEISNGFKIYGYGVSRYPSIFPSISISNDEDYGSLFSRDSSALVNLEEWLMQLDYAAKNKRNKAQEQLDKIKTLLYSEVFPEIEDFRCQSSKELKNYVEFKVKGAWCKYDELGFGYQSMMSWVIDLCKKMFERYPKSDNPLEESAIVLVDEIDLHLHPQWQRTVIPYLSKVFKNTQFFVTTHSPMVLQSAKDINLFVLNHNEDGFVDVEPCMIHDFRGWTIEEILKETMGLENDIYSDDYQRLIEEFDQGLDENNKDQVLKAYDELIVLLHPNNPVKRILEMQKNQMMAND